MKTTISTIVALLVTATRTMAAASSYDGEGLSLFATFFMAFGVMIVLFQLIPGIMLLFGMLKGIFASSRKPGEATVSTSKQ